MAKALGKMRDPVVTCGGELLRFEGFSACCGVYARVDLEPGAYKGVFVSQGTTNIDFNEDMQAALAQVRDTENVGLAVGSEDFALLKGADQIVERKVKLPLRWIRGFIEVQAYQSRMEKRFEIDRIETLRFLRSLPRAAKTETKFWIVPAGRGLRVSPTETSDGVRIAGLDRLRLLEDLAPLADALRIYSDPAGQASLWELHLGPIRFSLAVSAEVWRGFSGEGQALASLIAELPANLLEQARASLKWQAELREEEFAQNWDCPGAQVRAALSALGSRGLVGYDLRRAAFFHRELPFDLSLVEEIHPRLQAARALVAEKKIRTTSSSPDHIEAEVEGSGVTHRVRITDQSERCTCDWFSKHQGSRGPCKHILAARLAADQDLE